MFIAHSNLTEQHTTFSLSEGISYMSKMLKYCAKLGRALHSVWLSFTNKPRCWKKKGAPAEGWIIKYAWYFTMFHSTQMSQGGLNSVTGFLRGSWVWMCPHVNPFIHPQTNCLNVLANDHHKKRNKTYWTNVQIITIGWMVSFIMQFSKC